MSKRIYCMHGMSCAGTQALKEAEVQHPAIENKLHVMGKVTT